MRFKYINCELHNLYHPLKLNTSILFKLNQRLLLPLYILIDAETRIYIISIIKRIFLQKREKPTLFLFCCNAKLQDFDGVGFVLRRENFIKSNERFQSGIDLALESKGHVVCSYLNPGISEFATNIRIEKRVFAMFYNFESFKKKDKLGPIVQKKDSLRHNFHLLLKRILGKTLRLFNEREHGWKLQVIDQNGNWRQVKLQTNAADPFLILESGSIRCYFESYNRSNRLGKIESFDLLDFLKKPEENISTRVELELGSHLSFPNVFYFNDALCMIPENSKSSSLKIYSKSREDQVWSEFVTVEEDGKFYDPIFLENEGEYFIFASVKLEFDSLGSYVIRKWKWNNANAWELDSNFYIWNDDFSRAAGSATDLPIYQSFNSGIYGAYLTQLNNKRNLLKLNLVNSRKISSRGLYKTHHYDQFCGLVIRDVSKY